MKTQHKQGGADRENVTAIVTIQCTPRAWDIITPWDKRLCWLQFQPNFLDF